MVAISAFGSTITVATRPLATGAIPFNKAASRVAGLSNGQIAVIWGGETGYVDQYGVFLTRADVFGRVLNSDGSFASAEFVVRENVPDTSFSNGHPAPSITALAGGRFVVSTEGVTTFNTADQGPTVQVFNANGTTASGIIRLSMPITQYGFTSTATGWDPVLDTLSDGRFVALWRPTNATVGFRIFNADGTNSSANVIVSSDDLTTPGPEFAYDPAVAALNNGGLVAAWETQRTDGSGTSLHARIYTSAAAPVGAEFQVNTTTLSGQHEPSITTLTDGRFVITWVSEDTADGDGTVLRGRIFSEAGVASGDDFIVNTTYQGDQLVPSMAALDGGRFVVVWRSTDQGTGDVDTIRARVFESDGTAAADFVVGSEPISDDEYPSVTALADGRFAVSWWAWGGGNSVATRVQIYSVDAAHAIPGSTGDDTYYGGAAGDQLSGADGNDALYGLAGVDTLDGGAGNDTLDGGAGADRLNGGADDDTIVWEAGDELAFILGGTGTDTLRVLNQAAPTSFDLASHQFERANVVTDDAGGNWWLQISDYYNASWQRTNTDTRADDGRLIQTTYDVSAGGTAVNWQYITDYRNASNALTNQDGRFDNGNTFAKSFDYATGTAVDGVADWLREYTYFFRNLTEQQQGRVNNVEGYADDGRKFTQTNDIDSNQTWSYQTDWYEVVVGGALALDYKEIGWDNGSVQIIQY